MLNEFLVSLNDRLAANRRGSFILDIAALSLLIDRGLSTHEQAIQRIREVQNAMPESYRSHDVNARVDFAVDVLRQVYGSPQRRWTPKVIEGGAGRHPD